MRRQHILTALTAVVLCVLLRSIALGTPNRQVPPPPPSKPPRSLDSKTAQSSPESSPPGLRHGGSTLEAGDTAPTVRHDDDGDTLEAAADEFCDGLTIDEKAPPPRKPAAAALAGFPADPLTLTYRPSKPTTVFVWPSGKADDGFSNGHRERALVDEGIAHSEKSKAMCEYDRKQAKVCLEAARAWFAECSGDYIKYQAYQDECALVYDCPGDEGDTGESTGESTGR